MRSSPSIISNSLDREIDAYSKKTNIACQNLKATSQAYPNTTFHIEKVNGEEVIRVDSLVKNIWSRLFSNTTSHSEVQRILKGNVEWINRLDRSAFFNGHEHSELFIAAHKYNQACANDPSLPPVTNRNVKELKPLTLQCNQPEPLQGIPDDQKIYVQKGLFYYDEADSKINHGTEAGWIGFWTQLESCASKIGRLVSHVSSVSWFDRFHYFTNNQDDIYRHDMPTNDQGEPTSYWIGHATCLINVPMQSSSGSIPINILTDPIEGDLFPIAYPRMTKEARKVEDCPAVHVMLLTHNHKDHFSPSTVSKLLSQQPVMIVPQGDGKKLTKLGFSHVVEMNWWEKVPIVVQRGIERVVLEITAVPSHHWSNTGITDANRSAFVGYVIHHDQSDIYFAGDTARLSDKHIQMLRNRFHIQSMFMPGGPDEIRKYMESTHQSSADGLKMVFALQIKQLYETQGARVSKEQFLEKAKQFHMLYMHTKTYKLGNLHFDDTDKSVQRVLTALSTQDTKNLKHYELVVYKELLDMAKDMQWNGVGLTSQEVHDLLQAIVRVPKIGERSKL